MAAESASGVPLELIGLLTPLPADGGPVPGTIIEHEAHAIGHAAVLLADRGVLLAGDMLSDVLIPLLDPRRPDQVAAYATALDLLGEAADARGLSSSRATAPSPRAPEVAARLAADRAYLDALRRGVDLSTPGWSRTGSPVRTSRTSSRPEPRPASVAAMPTNTGRISLRLAMSLDGYIADADGGYDWIQDVPSEKLDTDHQVPFDEYLRDVDVVVNEGGRRIDLRLVDDTVLHGDRLTYDAGDVEKGSPAPSFEHRPDQHWRMDVMPHIKQFDHIGITVADLDGVTAFFVDLGLEIEGRTFVEGDFIDVVTGIPDSRSEIVMLAAARRRDRARARDLRQARAHGPARRRRWPPSWACATSASSSRTSRRSSTASPPSGYGLVGGHRPATRTPG